MRLCDKVAQPLLYIISEISSEMFFVNFLLYPFQVLIIGNKL